MQLFVQNLCERALRMAGRGDKNSVDELNQAVTSLNLLLASWRLRGVDLFDVHDSQLVLEVTNVVTNDGVDYICIRENSGTDSTTEPGTGANWETYWKEISGLTSDGSWSDTETYSPGSKVLIPSAYGTPIHSIVNPRVVQEGQVYSVELVERDTFSQLDPNETGRPTKVYQAPGPNFYLYLWPTPAEENLSLFYTQVVQPVDHSLQQTVGINELWQPALQYGLAAELAYYYALPADRIAPLVQKAEIEFKRALGSDKGGTDSCFVKSCF